MRGMASRLLCAMLPSAVLAEVCNGGSEWVDLDTPSDACTKLGKDDKPFKLIFSDEFELPGRSFRDGEDARWTGMDSWPNGNAQVSYYNSSLPVTHGGRLHMPTVRHFVPPRKNDEGIELEGTEKYYQTAMIQTWNKFCFSTSGIVEMKARLPGEATMPGLWPAFWIMGNLGRATLESSTDGIWPFSYDECVLDGSEDCEAAQCHSQRISACDDAPAHGLHPRQGRGSPEVDILEAIPGNPKTTGAHSVYNCYPAKDGSEKSQRLEEVYEQQLTDKDLLGYLQMPRPQLIGSYQVAPGMPRGAIARPRDACLPLEGEWYPWNFSKQTQRFWYDGATEPDPGIVVMPTYAFFGSNLTKEPDHMSTVQGWQGGGGHPFWVQTDSLSATTPLTAAKWAGQHVYSIEWRATEKRDGYMRWMLDGEMYFELPETLLSTPRQMHYEGEHHKGGQMKGRMLPREPMYVILNVDMSPNWGWPEWYRCNLGDCDCCMDCSDPRCTTCYVDTQFTTPRNDFIGDEWQTVNAFQWFADMCDTIPSMDKNPHMDIGSGLLDLSYQIEYVRVYQPEEAINLGCDPPDFPTAEWIDDHEQDYTAAEMEKPIKSVIPGGGACSEDADCGGGVTPGVLIPRGSCSRGKHGVIAGTCECATGWVGPHCMSQSAGIAAACESLEKDHMRGLASGSLRCYPPADYNRTMLQHVIDAFCDKGKGGSEFKASDAHLLDGTNTAGIAIHKACADVASRGGMHFSCSEPAKAAVLTEALSDATGRCCNTVTLRGEHNEPMRSLACRGVNEPAAPPPPSPPPPSPHHPPPNPPPAPAPPGWLFWVGGCVIMVGLVGIAMYAKQRLAARRGELAPASDYHAMPPIEGL